MPNITTNTKKRWYEYEYTEGDEMFFIVWGLELFFLIYAIIIYWIDK